MNGIIKLDSTNPRHNELARLVLAKNDIQAAKAAAHFVVEKVTHPKDPLFTPMSCAMVICYSRPFIVRRNYASLSQRYSRFQNDALRGVHDYLIEHRNAFEAHRDEELNTVGLMQAGTEVSWMGGGAVLSSHGEFISSRSLKLNAFPSFITLFDFQIERLQVNLEEQKNILFPINNC